VTDATARVASSWEQQARIVGGYRWIEHRLFELTGAWSTTSAEPEVALHLASASMHHAQHSQWWAERLPVRDGVDPEALSVPYGPLAGPLIDWVVDDGDAEPPSLASDVERLARLYSVFVPRLYATYRVHRSHAVAVSEQPVIDVLDLVLMRSETHVVAGEAVLGGPWASDAEREAAVRRLRSADTVTGTGESASALFAWPVSDLETFA
jgi:hypothetical protein